MSYTEDEQTLIGIAEEYGMSQDWIFEELINSVADMGLVMMELNEQTKPVEGGVFNAEGDTGQIEGVTFTTEDDIGPIEITVRRVKSTTHYTDERAVKHTLH